MSDFSHSFLHHFAQAFMSATQKGLQRGAENASFSLFLRYCLDRRTVSSAWAQMQVLFLHQFWHLFQPDWLQMTPRASCER